MTAPLPPVLGKTFAEMKHKMREIPEVETYLTSYSAIVGHIVFARRVQLGYTQTRLAELAGTTQHRISEMESGTGNVTMNIVDNVFRCLKIQTLNATFDEQAAALPTMK